jgi:hypothetical protein
MRKLLLLAASAAFLGLTGQASANLVLNPGFDLDTPAGGTAPLDWTLTHLIRRGGNCWLADVA